MDDVKRVEEDPSDLVILAWLFVLFELDILFWVGVIRLAEAVL